MRYFFEEYAFDTDRRELHRGTNLVSITPQVFDLLDYLIRNRERVVTKDDLISVVWNGRIVSDTALTTRLNAARAAIGDGGDKQRLIKTLPRKGFRFIGSVQEVQRPVVPPPADVWVERSSDTVPTPASPPRLSIVVLPFANLSGDPEQDYFVDGVTESLTTDLSRIAGAFVIGRSTAFSFKGKAVDVREIGRELNVRYVLEGSVQRGGNRFRLNAQLTDTQTRIHLWAERFDKPAADLLDMQDEIVSRLANTLNAELINAEARRAERSHRPDAMDLYFQGRVFLNKGATPAFLARAKDFFVRGLALDPDNIEAAVAAAQVDVSMGSSFMTDDGSVHFKAAESALNSVLLRAPNHPRAHMLLGAVQIRTSRAAKGIAECHLALALDRNLADAHGFIGLGKYALERGDEVEGHVQDALRLSPRDTRAFLWFMFVGMAKLMTKADLGALEWLRRSIEANPNHALSHFHFAGALAMIGNLKEARSSAEAGLALDRSFTIRRYRINVFRFDNPEWMARLEQLYEGMRTAGIPEG